MPRVIAQGDRRPVRRAKAPLRAQDQVRIARDVVRLQPMPAFWLQREEVARGPVPQHLVGQRQRALRAVSLGLDLVPVEPGESRIVSGLSRSVLGMSP